MESFLLSAVETVIDVVGMMFDLLFFWLPADPLADYLNSVDVRSVAGQAVSWLNWFVDVQTFAGVLSAFVTVLLLFAVWQVVLAVVRFITNLVQAVKPL